MPRAKKNRGAALPVDPTLDLSPEALSRGQGAFNDWHWGENVQAVKDWNDADMPDMLIECGRLVRLHVRAPKRENPRHPRRERDTMIEFSRSVSEGSHIAYDPDHPYERLYLLVPPGAQQTLSKRFWYENNFHPMNLNEIAMVAGGRHGRRQDYPDIMVKPVGVLTAVVYFTHKKGDGPSYYIHKVGELSGKFPFLCCDQIGRLWLAGGNYTSPSPGITD